MKELRTACLLLAVLTVLLGAAYPLAVTGVCRLLWPRRADGSLVRTGGRTVGSALISQSFTGPGYFHGRPSDCGHDAAGSASSNLGPSNPALLDLVRQRVADVRRTNGLDSAAAVPSELVLASASGLDPDLSPAAAMLQTRRIARARNLPEATVAALVRRMSRGAFLGVFCLPRVNVLELNLALDSLSRNAAVEP